MAKKYLIGWTNLETQNCELMEEADSNRLQEIINKFNGDTSDGIKWRRLKGSLFDGYSNGFEARVASGSVKKWLDDWNKNVVSTDVLIFMPDGQEVPYHIAISQYIG